MTSGGCNRPTRRPATDNSGIWPPAAAPDDKTGLSLFMCAFSALEGIFVNESQPLNYILYQIAPSLHRTRNSGDLASETHGCSHFCSTLDESVDHKRAELERASSVVLFLRSPRAVDRHWH